MLFIVTLEAEGLGTDILHTTYFPLGAVAVIFDVPYPTAFTTPPLTDAIDVLSLFHVIVLLSAYDGDTEAFSEYVFPRAREIFVLFRVTFVTGMADCKAERLAPAVVGA